MLILRIVFLISCLSALPGFSAPADKAKELGEYIKKEKPEFERREVERRGILEQLDRINSDQNQVRARVEDLRVQSQELQMALENLKLEVQKQRNLEFVQKKRLMMLLKMAYKIKRDGMLRFVASGANLTDLASRMRILYWTLKSHGKVTQQMQDRAMRLREGEMRLETTQDQNQDVMDQLKEQEAILADFLKRKQKVLSRINQQQGTYQLALKEFKQVSKRVTALFQTFESKREPALTPKEISRRGAFNPPVANGKIIKGFGKSVHEKFHTVTYHRGIEIEAPQQAPVTAVMAGKIEYEGWVKGLGNVVILHHGGGFYTLNAHLFKGALKVGADVAAGEVIGYVGDTGDSDKPSLYFEVRENGKAVNPLAYFSKTAIQQFN